VRLDDGNGVWGSVGLQGSLMRFVCSGLSDSLNCFKAL
jgi:hypothetical protein